MKLINLSQILGLGLALSSSMSFAAPEKTDAVGGTTCSNNKNGPKCGPCEENCEGQEGGESSLGSGASVINGDFQTHFSAPDFKFDDPTGSCGSCGATPIGGTGSLPVLDISRHTKIRQYSNYNSFGMWSGFANYDRTLHFVKNRAFIKVHGLKRVEKMKQMFYDSSRQSWTETDAIGKNFFGVSMYDSAGVLISSGANRDQAHTAILLHHDGSTEHYEIVWKSNGEGRGRLVALMDRNGNAISIEYAQAQPASPLTTVEDLDDYSRKSKITNAYGRSVTITTAEQAGTWVVTRVDFPNGEHATYEYADMGDLGNPVLSKVNHPNGAQTQWTVSTLAGPNLTELSIYEPNAAEGQRHLNLYYTKKSGYDAQGAAISTTQNMLRIAENGEGEVIYANRLGSDTYDKRYLYEGGNRYMLLTTSASTNGISYYGSVKAGSGIDATYFSETDTTQWDVEKFRSQVSGVTRYANSITDGLSRSQVIGRHPITQSVTHVTHPDGTSSTRSYTIFDQLLSGNDRLGRSSANTYDATGNRLSSTQAVGTSEESTTTYLYNTRGQLIEQRDALYDANQPELHNTQYVYNAAGYMTKKIDAADTAGGSRPETNYTYDSLGRVISTTDPSGRVTSYEYDNLSRAIKVTYNDGSTELVSYQPGTSLVASRSDRNGILTTYTYDLAGRTIETRVAAGTAEESLEICSYLEGTRKKESCTINGETVTYQFDHRNRVIGSTRHASANSALTSSTEYDQLSRRRSSTDAYGRKTFYLYDQNDRITRTVTETVPGALDDIANAQQGGNDGVPAITEDAQQSSSAHNYVYTDKEGNSLETDPDDEGRTHQVSYSCARDLFLAGLSRDLSSNASYLISDRITDAEGQTLVTTDPRGIVSWSAYDAQGRSTLSIRAVGTAEEVRSETLYDDASNVIETRSPRYFTEGPGTTANLTGVGKDVYSYNGRNLKASHTYDLAGRMTTRDYTGTDGITQESTDTFTYDRASRLLTTHKGRHNITTTHTYNNDGTPATEKWTVDTREYTIARTYDAGNRPTTQTFADNKVQAWNYDARNLVTSATYANSATDSNPKTTLTQTHDAGYRLTTQAFGNNLTRTISYSRLDNLRTSDNVAGEPTLQMSYTYAADKQILSETIAGGVMENASFTADYDPGNRLTSWTRDGNVGILPSPTTQTWNYDNAGNWNSTNIDGTTQNRTHNPSDQPTNIGGNATTHDARGNMTSFTDIKPTGNTTHTLAFDPDNRLVTATLSTDNNPATYRYDAFGRRIIREHDGTKTAYLWWGNQEVSEHETNANKTTIQNDLWAHPTALNTLYARAVDGSKSKIEYYHKNYLDHVYAVTDDSGDILEHYRYNAFGEVEIYTPSGTRLTTTAIANHITWNTRRTDPLTGYHYYLYRHYTPQLGRWPTRDLIEEKGGVNLYTFVGNDPIFWRDELGLAGIPTDSEPGIMDQLTGYERYRNRWSYFSRRYPNFMFQETVKWFDAIEPLIKSKCAESYPYGYLRNGEYRGYFKSQKSFDIREDYFPDQRPPSYHLDDERQSRYEAQFALGQFTLGSENVYYEGKMKIDDCECAIKYRGELVIYDTPGYTTGEDGDDIKREIADFFLVPIDSPSVRIASTKLEGWVCCDE